MSDDWQTANPHAEREQINQAREAAEALFRPKQSQVPVQAPVASSDAPPPAEQHVPRPPRIFTIAPVSAIDGEQSNVTVTPKRQALRTSITHPAPAVMRSDHGRIRALVQYGMTTEQVADLYQVPVSRIERIVGAK